MRSKLQLDVLLRAVGDAAVASRAMTLTTLETRASAALNRLTEAIDADRACLCYTTGRATTGVLDRFVSGGRPEVATIGPALLGVHVEDVPEWSTAGGDAQPTPRVDLSPTLEAALAGSAASWALSVALREVDAVIGVLSVIGCGDPPVDDLVPAVAAMTDLMHSVAHRAIELAASSPTLAQALRALDVVTEGVLIVDVHGRVVASNRAARELLGCDPGELDVEVPVWEQFDIRLLDGAPVMAADATDRFDRAGVIGPTPVRLVDHHGLGVSGELTVRAFDLDVSTGSSEMVLVFAPFPGAAATSEPSTVESVLRRAHEVFDELQRAITGTVRPAGAQLPAPLATIGLSPREREVVVLLLEGHRVSTIAQRLFLSPHTVRNHLKAIFRKAKVGSQAELVDLGRSAALGARP